MIKVTKNFDLGKINLDLHKELNLAGQIIREDHNKRLQSGKGVDGSGMTPLKDATVKAKGFDQILVNSGSMGLLVIDKATTVNQEVNIHPGNKRKRKSGVTNQELGGFHQDGAGNLPKREWFGISKEAEAKSDKLIFLRINRIIDNA